MPISDAKQSATPVAPEPGFVKFFVDADGFPKAVDENGNVTDFVGPQGPTGPAGDAGDVPQTAFKTITTTTGGPVVADVADDTLTLAAGAGVSITGDAAADSITIANTDLGSAARTAHEAAGDPHSQYTTTAEAAAAAPVQSVSAGTGMTVSPTTGAVVVTNADRGSVARTAHEAAGDPHPQYTTSAEAAAAAPVQSVTAGTGMTVSPTTGAVVVTNADRGSVARTAHEAASDPHPTYLTQDEGDARYPQTPFLEGSYTATGTVVSTVTDVDLVTISVPANRLAAGASFVFEILANQTNATTASTIGVYVKVNGTKLFTSTQGMGTTAATNRGLHAAGLFTFKTVGSSGTVVGSSRMQASSLTAAIAAAAAATTVNTTAIVTLVLGMAYTAAGTGSNFTPQAASLRQVR